ncbi:MAG: hypothetical protein KA179_10090, partial [Sulfuritalea sp.]|nr:hypothetical protein [Sulfuritalea sp.]
MFPRWQVLIALLALPSLAAAQATLADPGLCTSDGTKPETGIAACTRLIELDKLSPQAKSTYHSFRGDFWRAKGDEARAIADYTDSIRLNPASVTAFNRRGRTFEDIKEFERAMSDFNAAIQLDSQNSYALTGRGRIWQHKQN